MLFSYETLLDLWNEKKAKSVLTTLGAFLSQIWTGEQPNNLYSLHDASAFFWSFPFFNLFAACVWTSEIPFNLNPLPQFAAGTCCVFFPPGSAEGFWNSVMKMCLGQEIIKLPLESNLWKNGPRNVVWVCLGYIPGDEILPRTKNGGLFKQPKLAPLLVQLRELNLESNCWWFRNLAFTTRDP